MFTMLQWADTHHDNNINACNNMIKTSTGIDLPIHCGDFPPGYFEQGLGGVDLTKTMCVIGNHDAINQNGAVPTGYNWHMQASQSELRDRYVQPMIDNFGADSPDGCTWWKREYSVKNVTVIGINDTALDDVAATQLEWFNDVLSECERNNRAIVLVKHGPTTYAEPVVCNFTTYNAPKDEPNEYKDYTSTYPRQNDCIGALTKTTAKVICVLHGHDHWDCFQTITKTDGTKVPVIGIGSILQDIYNDVPRTSDNTLNGIVMNRIDYVPEVDALEVYRLGAWQTYNGCKRKMLVWDYKLNTIVSMCSNRGA